jgi:hypothetical protein
VSSARVLAAACLALALMGCQADRLLTTRTHDTGEGSLAAPRELAQKTGGRAPIIGATSVELSGEVEAQSPGDLLRLDVEVRRSGEAFTGAATKSSAPVASGERASVTLSAAESGSEFHWQARVRDDAGRLSTWRAYTGRSGTMESGTQ